MYYVEEYSSYSVLKSLNDFGEDPSEDEIKNLLLDEESSFSIVDIFCITKDNFVECYSASVGGVKQYLYVDSNTGFIISVMNSIEDAPSYSNDVEKICIASIEALTGYPRTKTENKVNNVVHLNSFTATDKQTYYNNGIVYDFVYEQSIYSNCLVATRVTESGYNSGVYWVPIPSKEKSYFATLADQFFQTGQYEDAIDFYGLAGVVDDRIKESYYKLAEQYLNAHTFSYAIEYFELAGKYKDSSSRVLEVYYTEGSLYEANKDYISAIECYKNAKNYSDAKEKVKECNYLQGELLRDLKSKYLETISYYKEAADYLDAKEKYKELCYLYADQQLNKERISDATEYFKLAGDYKDASMRMTMYYYDKGNSYFESGEYSQAIESFKKVIDYEDSVEKYKQCNYLYAEILLANGDVQNAKVYLYNANGYKDADVRVSRYYYENGNKLFATGEFISAIDQYALAGDYSDAPEMISECYYTYGKQQMSLGYVTNGTTAFSKCRGYKDTDEILLSYYYKNAKEAFNIFLDILDDRVANGFKYSAYNDAINQLSLCEGYSDSNELISVSKLLMNAYENTASISKNKLSLYEMSASYTDGVLAIKKNTYIQQTGARLNLSYDCYNDLLVVDVASISFYDKSKNVALWVPLVLFTSITDTTDLANQVGDLMKYEYKDSKYTYTTIYGGYDIDITLNYVSRYDSSSLHMEVKKHVE